MKRFVTFISIVATLVLGMPWVALGSHTIASISPFTGAPGATIPAAIIGTGFCNNSPPAPLGPFPCNVGAGFSGSGIQVNSVVATSPTSISINFTISPSASTGTRALTITTSGDSVNIAFTVVVGGPGGPGGPGGGGFVEDVPTRFGPIPEGPQTGGEFISVVEGITNWIFVILLVFAVIFILLAAFQFIAGGGDPQAVAQARQKLIWAAVGIAVAVLARGIPAAIGNLFL